jgi:hypothetical protein
VFKFMNPDEKGESIAAKLVRKKQGWIFFVIGWDWDSVCQVGCVHRDLKTYIKIRVKRFVCWFNLFGFLLKRVWSARDVFLGTILCNCCICYCNQMAELLSRYN